MLKTGVLLHRFRNLYRMFKIGVGQCHIYSHTKWRGGGNNGPAQSFHTPQCRSTNKLVGLKTYFSLGKGSFKSVQIQSKSSIIQKTEKIIER